MSTRVGKGLKYMTNNLSSNYDNNFSIVIY